MSRFFLKLRSVSRGTEVQVLGDYSSSSDKIDVWKKKLIIETINWAMCENFVNECVITRGE